MIYPTLNELAEKVDSRYSLVVAVAKRSRQIVDGSKPLVSIESNKPVTIAVNELNQGKVRYKRPKEGIK